MCSTSSPRLDPTRGYFTGSLLLVTLIFSIFLSSTIVFCSHLFCTRHFLVIFILFFRLNVCFSSSFHCSIFHAPPFRLINVSIVQLLFPQFWAVHSEPWRVSKSATTLQSELFIYKTGHTLSKTCPSVDANILHRTRYKQTPNTHKRRKRFVEVLKQDVCDDINVSSFGKTSTQTEHSDKVRVTCVRTS